MTQTTAGGQPLDLAAALQLLEQSGHLSSEDAALLRQRRRTPEELRQPVLGWLASQNLQDRQPPGHALDIEQLTRIIAARTGHDYYRIDPLRIDVAAITGVMSYAFTQRHRILAVEVTPDEVVVACEEPFVTGWEADLAHVNRRDIRRVLANPMEIRRLATEFYSLASSIRQAEGKGGPVPPGVGNLEQMLDLGSTRDPEANDQHIVSIVDWLLQYAFEQRASDIHIEPRRDTGNIRFRIDGVLYTVYALPMKVLSAVVSRLKVLGRMNVAEKRKPQDGRLKTRSPNGDEVELRLSTLPTAFGEKLVMRIFDPEVLLRSFSSLGLKGGDLERWQQMVQHNHGIIVITGPTGSGKTTTLYSTLKSLATDEVNVCTIEDPIEMVVPVFNQMQVQDNIGLDFASGVKALMRQDPDIIMIGEIR
ncbi:MAG: GspE/PulE family protein, partial [Pseudomonadota bacterium]